MTSEVRIVLVGAGQMGANHRRVLAGIQGATLAEIVDPKLAGDHATLGGVPVRAAVGELDLSRVDLAVIATPTVTHEELALEFVRAGVATLIEKPVSDTVASALRIKKVADESDVLVAVGHVERFNPAVIELRARLQRGELGEIYQVATRRLGSYPVRISDVGVSKDLATHDFDLTSWITEAHYDTVFAQTFSRSGRPHEDMIAVTGRLTNGVIVNHVVNWMSPQKERTVAVTGERGMFVADTLLGDLVFHENGNNSVEWETYANFRGVSEGNSTKFAYPRLEPLYSELNELIRVVSGREGAVVSLEDGIRALTVSEAVLKSASADASVVVLPSF